jgi:hypothetical protein
MAFVPMTVLQETKEGKLQPAQWKKREDGPIHHHNDHHPTAAIPAKSTTTATGDHS